MISEVFINRLGVFNHRKILQKPANG